MRIFSVLHSLDVSGRQVPSSWEPPPLICCALWVCLWLWLWSFWTSSLCWSPSWLAPTAPHTSTSGELTFQRHFATPEIKRAHHYAPHMQPGNYSTNNLNCTIFFTLKQSYLNNLLFLRCFFLSIFVQWIWKSAKAMTWSLKSYAACKCNFWSLDRWHEVLETLGLVCTVISPHPHFIILPVSVALMFWVLPVFWYTHFREMLPVVSCIFTLRLSCMKK